MRQQLCDALVARASDARMVFLTGDLGFMALEPLQKIMGERFINAGVAEQNMLSVAAGLARQQLKAWVYSIAPFCYARPFEQVRNDIAFHKLPVRLIGNGGGYGYGVMGPTHHAIEDYGVLCCLPNMSIHIPVFDDDVAAVIARIDESPFTTYLRLGRGEAPRGYRTPPYAPWRQLTTGAGPTVIAVGPLAGLYIERFAALEDQRRPNLWAVAELPLERNPLPDALLAQLAASRRLLVVEEHVQNGGFASQVALKLLADGHASVNHFQHLYARAHHFDRYGSQNFLRGRAGIDVASVMAALESSGAPS